MASTTNIQAESTRPNTTYFKLFKEIGCLDPFTTDSVLDRRIARKLNKEDELREEGELRFTEPRYIRFIPSTMFKDLQAFIRSSESSSLWLIGPYDNSYPSAMSYVAVWTGIAVAENDKNRILVYLCELVPEKSKEQLLNSLLYTLIDHLVAYLPLKLETSLDFQHERFARLDGTTKTWSAALGLLNDLLFLIPPDIPNLLCIIDGFELIDDESWSEYYKELLTTILNAMSQQKEKCMFKVLFTSTGHSATLKGALNEREIRKWTGPLPDPKDPSAET